MTSVVVRSHLLFCRQNIPKQRANITLYKYESIIHVVLHESFFRRIFLCCCGTQSKWDTMNVGWVHVVLPEQRVNCGESLRAYIRYSQPHVQFVFCAKYLPFAFCFSIRIRRNTHQTHTQYREHMQIRHGMATFSQCVFWVFNYAGVWNRKKHCVEWIGIDRIFP